MLLAGSAPVPVLTLARMSGPMHRRDSVHSSFCSISTAPTRRMMARRGRVPTTSVRRRSSRFRRSVDALYASAAHKEAVARLRWLISARGLGVLTGEVGCGKDGRRPRRRGPGRFPPHPHLPVQPADRSGIHTAVAAALGQAPRFHHATLIPLSRWVTMPPSVPVAEQSPGTRDGAEVLPLPQGLRPVVEG